MPDPVVRSTEPRRMRVSIKTSRVTLAGDLEIPPKAVGVVLFAHGSGSSRRSARNLFVANSLRLSGIGTLLFDLLTPTEESPAGDLRFDITLLTARLMGATNWLAKQPEARHLALGYFRASTGAAAALVAAAALGPRINAVVSRGGRPDLARDVLERVQAPTLLIVGERDETVRELNQEAYALLQCTKQIKVIPNATHLFEERGALGEVACFAAAWFREYLPATCGSPCHS
jgi:putative phosphoribosyl transferase